MKGFILLAVLVRFLTIGWAQDRLLTVEDLYHPKDRINFSGSRPLFVQWLKDGKHFLQRGGPDQEPLLKVEARSGKLEALFDPVRLKEAFLKLPDFGEAEAERASRRPHFTLSPDESALLVPFADDLFLFDLDSSTLTRLTQTADREREVAFSPDGQMLAYVKGTDLYSLPVNGQERRLTHDGNAQRRNGLLDWVYQEELYGRGDFKAYWWSPDSRHIAFLQLEDEEVPEFTVVDHLPLHLQLEVANYPKSGDRNPSVRLGILTLPGGQIEWVDLYRYSASEFLIVRVGWSPNSQNVVFQVQDREQTWLDLNLVSLEDGEVRTLLRETSEAWVNRGPEPIWLKDGSFIWQSERSGWKHLYLYSEDGTLKNPITEGEWEVRRLLGVDEAREFAYLLGTKDGSRERHVYQVSLDGDEIRRVTRKPGFHSANFNADKTLFVSSWSDVHTPTQTQLLEASGELVRKLDDNPVEVLQTFKLGSVEFHQVPTRDGFLMEAMLIKPPDFDPTNKYPVLSHTYSGPQTPRVSNSWGGVTYMWHQMLAQKGYLIWICDNRTASGKGVQSAWPGHRNLGELELRDLEDGLNWLKSKPWVDGSRIGLWGWSYGGYMTSYALTHSTSFKIGIAGAPVTDWRLYDSIYTERYMGMPQNNREGYDKSSVVNAAEHLSGKLLLIHGTTDDNVHMQNSIWFIHALQKAGKQFEFMLYPRSRHSVRDPELNLHLRTLMTRFIEENL